MKSVKHEKFTQQVDSVYSCAMFIFILLNLIIGYLFKVQNSLTTLLFSDVAFYLGLVLIAVCFVSSVFKFKALAYQYRYDLFAAGSMLVWIVYWPVFFRIGSPVFIYIPFYFAFIAAFCSLVLIKQNVYVEPETLNWLHWLSDSGRFNPLVIMVAIMISLALPRHFLFFPTMMTIFILRYILANYLNNE